MEYEGIDGPTGRRIAMRIQYDGSEFFGWQRQPRGRTVQQTLEEMLSKVSGNRPVAVIAAGRTDSGVHASGQVAHADVVTDSSDGDLLRALRRMSPSDLVVSDLITAPRDFHARYRACRRSYRYSIALRPDPFLARYSWWLPWALDVGLLEGAAELFLGDHDFTALSKHNPDTPNPRCNVGRSRWTVDGDRLDFHISADRFLYGMVRLIVGIQIDVARGRRRIGEIVETMRSLDRNRQSMSAPARGLTLISVGYPEPCFDQGCAERPDEAE